MNKHLLAVPLLLLSSACVNSVRVYGEDCNGNTVKLKGLPFYGKTQKFKRTSVYELQWLEATMTVDVGAGAGDSMDRFKTSATRIVFPSDSEGLFHVEQFVKAPKPAERRIAVGDFFRLPILSVPSPYSDLGILISDHVETIAVVDYDNRMYLNAPLPWSGSSTVSANYNGDGTLGELSVATTQDVSEILPIKELVSDALGSKSTDSTFLNNGKSGITVILDVVRKRRLVTFTKIAKHHASVGSTLDCSNPGDGYTLKTSSSATSAAASSNSIKFSGSVTPPKQ